ncbi:uncharacterized protein V1513DRAFT_375742 [Lipomyces chichibuensis]|uniref:uncharacterized protein n=1 Tax=Lipomyces chichibuensis TaxID=1546026 RepID=UPI0033441367
MTQSLSRMPSPTSTGDCPRSPSGPLITPPPSTDILPNDPQCASEIAAFFLPPSVTLNDSKQPQLLPKDSFSDARTQQQQQQLTSNVQTRSKFAPSKLPPPPMRSRRIIQMQPVLPKPAAAVKTTTKQQSQSQPLETPAAPKSKRGTGSSTSAATRKTARKIAHSAIERRRRSKMNEEFDALKTMVPACRVASQTHGEASLHKLGILQATVEYVRYLEGCIGQLQARVESLESGNETGRDTKLDLTQHFDESDVDRDDEAKMDYDEEMEDDEDDEDEDQGDDDNDDDDAQESTAADLVPAPAFDDDDDMEEAGKEVSRTLLMLRHNSDSGPALALDGNNSTRVGIRVCDLLG